MSEVIFVPAVDESTWKLTAMEISEEHQLYRPAKASGLYFLTKKACKAFVTESLARAKGMRIIEANTLKTQEEAKRVKCSSKHCAKVNAKLAKISGADVLTRKEINEALKKRKKHVTKKPKTR